MEKISQRIREGFDPVVFPLINVAEINGKKIVVIEVAEAQEKPVLLRHVAYKRVGKTSPKISASEVRKIAKESGGKVYWDEMACKEATLKDIDGEKVKWFLNEAKVQRGLDIPENAAFAEALMRLKLLKNNKPTNAAVLLFGKEPDRFFTRPEVKCIRFKGTDVTDEMIDFKVVRGNLFDQLVETERFIYNNITMAAWIEDWKLQRQEKWEYPPKAIREVIANALCHRIYETSSSVQVRIFDDRMEFWNPGILPKDWTVETLKQKHESEPFNPLLLKQFFWIKYVEDVGTGTNKLLTWCKTWGLPAPLFELIAGDMVVTFRKYKITDDMLKELNERQNKGIEYLKKYKKITNKEYRRLNPDISDRTALNDLNELIKKNIILANGKKKDRYYTLM
ncbi:MAG: hypothetical protein CVT88_02480 [Candidatus Altiarchaeales archaeon HGW-Altiarchaeales-1]|nr:MAG: hypothetical protein CVT88_02480 [Candidatus Altiarchaeales archaeon HGW-Altiarchaeales-1]